MNKKCPCMKNDVCSKHYPKSFQDETSIDAQGFAIYRHRNDGRYITKNGHRLDNRYVVPYNIYLLKKYRLISILNGATKQESSSIFSSMSQRAKYFDWLQH